jgi:hypothetical protein
MSVTNADDPVETVLDILDAHTGWTNTTPEIYRMDETTPKGRENTQADSIYVRATATTELDRFSADPESQTENAGVDMLIYSLDNTRAKTLGEDLKALFQGYMNDNFTDTNWHNIEPTNITDTRGARVARQTDHYVFIVEVDLERLK